MSELSGPLAPPNLGAVITSADIDKKGTGSYAADYVNWARTAQLLRENAPGWQFHLRPTAEGQHVWEAPNGTGYVVGYFVGPGGTTPDFPQAVMDNRNAAMPLAKIDARDLTDTHRRCLCTAAAAQFGLAWQLWAKEPIENPHRDEPKQAPRPAAVAPTKAQQQKATTDARITLASAKKECREAGLTVAGVAAMATELSQGATTEIEGLPFEVQRKLGTAGVSAASVAKWNAAGATAAANDAAETDDDPDLPATWDVRSLASVVVSKQAPDLPATWDVRSAS
jgi:hypothetical protein